MNNEIFCHSMNNQSYIWYLQMTSLKKPEEFQIITPAAFVTFSGIADHNSNGNIMKLNSNHKPQSMK